MTSPFSVCSMVVVPPSGFCFCKVICPEGISFPQRKASSAPRSASVTEISKLPKVNVSFADPDNQHYVSITGKAQLVRDRNKIDELWRPEFKMWFPEGKEDPDIALLRVNLEKAEYWDSPSSTIGYALNFVSSLVSGKEADHGENRKIEFNS